MAMPAILRLLRPGDWTKGVFVLVPIVFWLAGEGRTVDASIAQAKVRAAFMAFVAIGLVASGWYALNDAWDAAEDRLHPTKRRRPVASGAVSAGTASIIGVACMLIGITLGFRVGNAAGWLIVSYAVLQAGYNLTLKRRAYLDVATIALGFTLRAVTGAVAIDVRISVWLVLCVFFLTLFLGFVKRTCDLVAAQRDGGGWNQRAGYGDEQELQFLLAISACMAVLMYLLYTLSDHAKGLYGAGAAGLALLTPFVLLVVYRFYRRARRGLSDSPLEVLRTDRTALVGMACFVAGTWASLYWPPAKQWLERLFIA
jgi:4-hydroxybenzoate polyprenyltransferase